jgi:putative hydrolase of the HAD superfamily
VKYKAVIFDLFGTLVYQATWSTQQSVLNQMASVLSISPEDIKKQWSDTFDARMKGEFPDYQANIKFICRQLDIPFNDSQIELASQVRVEMVKKEFTPREYALEVLTILKAKRLKTGLISDCSYPVPDIWPDTPLALFIDEVVFSCEVGIKKPDPRIYQITVDKLAVKPEECLYVADGIGQELASASKLGMHAVQILLPDEDGYDPYREEWDGKVISSLREVLNLLE